jgi:hypothetical protein
MGNHTTSQRSPIVLWVLMGLSGVLLTGIVLLFLFGPLIGSPQDVEQTASAISTQTIEASINDTATPNPTNTETLTGDGATLAAESTEEAMTAQQVDETATASALMTQTSEAIVTPTSPFVVFATEDGDAASDDPTPAATPTPLVIADAARVQVRSDVSGEIIGAGTITLYAPDVAAPGQSVRIELELALDDLYITPTPAGGVTVIPVTRVTATPRAFNAQGTPIPTPTERVAVAGESGAPFYQRMGASLFCPPGSFVGCDDERDVRDAQLVSTNFTSFTWLLRPSEEVMGVQDMRVELWITAENLDGDIEFIPQFTHDFTLEITDVTPGNNTRTAQLLIFGGFVTVILLGIGIGVLVQRGRAPTDDLDGETIKIPPVPGAATAKPKVFISYRRRPSWSVARSVANGLEARGADVFLDVDDINEGRFADVLQRAIENCDYFVPIIGPETLESKWVKREIEEAMRLDKPIIPLVTDGFSFYGADLPPELAGLSDHNAIKVLPEFFEEAVDRLATRFLKLEVKR